MAAHSAESPAGSRCGSKRLQSILPFANCCLKSELLAAAEIGRELSAAEIATLNSIPRTQIEQRIAISTVPDEHRRVFLGKIATAVLAMLSFGGSGCDSGSEVVGGIHPGDFSSVSISKRRS